MGFFDPSSTGREPRSTGRRLVVDRSKVRVVARLEVQRVRAVFFRRPGLVVGGLRLVVGGLRPVVGNPGPVEGYAVCSAILRETADLSPFATGMRKESCLNYK